jgi:hypothetical protein
MKRPRFTIRRLMIFAMIVGVIMGLVSAIRAIRRNGDWLPLTTLYAEAIAVFAIGSIVLAIIFLSQVAQLGYTGRKSRVR